MAKKKKNLSSAQKAALKKGQAILAAMRAAKKTPAKVRAGTKRAKKIVKKVEKQAKASKKEIAKDAKKAARVKKPKFGKIPHPAGTQYGPVLPPGYEAGAAMAAKRVADACAIKLKQQAKRISKNLKSECTREINKIKKTAEQSFKLAGFGEALGTLSKRPSRKRTRKATMPSHRGPGHPRAATAVPSGARRGPGRPRARVPHFPSSLPRMGSPHLREIGAEDVLRKVRAKVKGKMLDFWVCAGEKRTGCGNTGHVVTGGRMFPAVRFRPGPKQVFMKG
jgi:uncharacterized protein with PIN domain